MSAPAASVAAVQKALGCAKSLAPFMVGDDETWDCFRHGGYWTDRGCPVAVAAADAAVEAATPGIERAAIARGQRVVPDPDRFPIPQPDYTMRTGWSHQPLADRIEAPDAS